MKKVFARSIFLLLTLTLLALFNPACGPGILEQGQKNALEPPQKTEPSSAKTEESIFTVIETEDLEYPTLVAAIHLPFHANPNNTVVLAGQHAYVTTEKHLHVIDVSVPQRPVYLTSLSFLNEIGKVLVSGHHVIIASPEAFHIVDVSQPAQPVLQSTMHLPHRHAIKDVDVRDAHLYVMGGNGSLYVFSLFNGHARLVNAVEILRGWWLLSPKTVSPRLKVQQIKRSPLEKIPSDILDPLWSQRGFLQLRSSKNQKIRTSSNLLVVESIQHPLRASESDLLIYSVLKKRLKESDDEPQKFGVRFDSIFGKDYPYSKMVNKGDPRESGAILSMEFYYVWTECLHHLVSKEIETLTRGKPTIAYAVRAGKMKQVVQDSSVETIDIDVDDKLFAGPVMDFQIFGNLLYVVNAKGFFSIRGLITIGDFWEGEAPQFLSVTPLQASRPISLAVSKNFAYVLSTSRASQD